MMKIINIFKFRNYLLIIVFNCSFLVLVNAQSSLTPPISRLDILYPSPTATELGKYGEVKPNLSNGAMQYSIPLLEVRDQNLTLPISLNYFSNGLKVDQLASNVGMSWALNAGGMITRVVVGGDDFRKYSPYSVPPRALESPASFNNPDQSLISFLKNTAEYSSSQPDIFYFNFGEFSGKFVIDPSGKPVLIPYQNLKIELTENSFEHNFIITTPMGVRYYFDKVEWTKTGSLGAGCPRGIFAEQRVESAWYVSKVTHPKNGTIQFLYEKVNYSYFSSIDQTISIFTVLGQTCSPRFVGVSNQPNISTCKQNISIDGWQIKEINNSNGLSVRFMNSIRTDMPGNKRVDKITVFHSDIPSKSYELIYMTKGERMFLTALKESSAGTPMKKYSFGYSGVNYLPDRLSFSQDRFGFFNGRSNPEFFTPKVDGSFYFSQFFADRSSNGNVSIYGMLDTITYPTGGKSVITYESHKGKGEETQVVKEGISYEEEVWGGTTSNPIYGENTKELIFTTPPAPHESLGVSFIQATVKILVRNFGENFPDPFNRVVAYELYNMSSGQYVNGNIKGDFSIPVSINSLMRAYNDYSAVDNQVEYECTLNFNTQYRIRIKSMGSDLLAKMSIGGEFQTGNKNVITDFDLGGARVKSITTYDHSRITDVKNYTYNSLDNLKNGTNDRVLYMVNTFVNYQQLAMNVFCRDCAYASFDYDQLSSTYITTGLGGNHVYYNAVVEHKDNDFINGGIERKFMVTNDEMGPVIFDAGYPQKISSPLTNTGFMNGTEIYTCIFTKQNNGYRKIKESFMDYFIDPVNNARDVRGYVVRKEGPNPCSDDLLANLLIYKVTVFDYLSRWFYLKSIRNITYGESGVTEERESYDYDNPKHGLLSKTTFFKSKGDPEIISVLYPNDYANGRAFIDDMKNNYLIAYPIEQIRYKKSGNSYFILSGKITEFHNGGKAQVDKISEIETLNPIELSSFKFSNNLQGNLPSGSASAVVFSPYNGYKEKLIYLNYDTYGNPLAVKKTDGPVISYLWGYNGQYPVAEIVNAHYNDVVSAIGGQSVVDALNSGTVTADYIRQKMEILRSNLPGSQVTSYTYKPLVGMTSKTDARGQTEYYQYDGLQRLQHVLDQFQQLRQSYHYHYRPQ
ncbi:hypothetical protein ACFU8T_00005 [Sphingobacterium spiritivorum]|uniref:hypothetical protein n=2 Tax=Sphingobacterium spiritivorum TaxID=258 RepID=UPI0036960E76